METVNRKVKITLVGDQRVGKTSIRKRYMGEGFRGTYTQTLGADFSSKKVLGATVIIFDLAGDERSKIMRQQYYYGTDAVIMIFDISNRESFENLPKWFEEVQQNLGDRLKVFVLGNKDDLRDSIEDPVGEDEAYDYVFELSQLLESSISYLSTSAKTGMNVDVAFSKLLAEIIHGYY